jgi:hypothetical protein
MLDMSVGISKHFLRTRPLFMVLHVPKQSTHHVYDADNHLGNSCHTWQSIATADVIAARSWQSHGNDQGWEHVLTFQALQSPSADAAQDEEKLPIIATVSYRHSL